MQVESISGLVVPGSRSIQNLDFLWDLAELLRRSKLLLGLTCFEPPNCRKWLKYDRVGREDDTDFLDVQPQIILW